MIYNKLLKIKGVYKMQVQVKGITLEVEFNRYFNNNISMDLMVNEDGYREVYYGVSVNLEHINPENTVLVKNWSENEGIEEVLVELGLIEKKPIAFYPSGYVLAPLYRLTQKAIEELEKQEQEESMEDDLKCCMCGESIKTALWRDLFKSGDKVFFVSGEVEFNPSVDSYDLDGLYPVLKNHFTNEEIEAGEFLSMNPDFFTREDIQHAHIGIEHVGAYCLECNGSN